MFRVVIPQAAVEQRAQPSQWGLRRPYYYNKSVSLDWLHTVE